MGNDGGQLDFVAEPATAGESSAVDPSDMMEVPGTSDSEGNLMTNPGSPFDALLDARGLSRDNAVAVLVDDNEGVLATMPDIMQFGFNVRVLTAINGQKGLVVLEQNHGNVALVLSDTNMPKMSGPEMLRAAKERGLLDRVPVVIATAESALNGNEIASVIADGAAHKALEKPFAPYELIEAINSACTRILEEMKNGTGDRDTSLDETPVHGLAADGDTVSA